ncbi:clathrin coat assembly protein AP180-like [Salvia hispanica]|uniref:clathrin coat assembly protein AP180-like n=1 Tax=Salvia hispanica TaxID=49212 RepID=UPI002009C70C|nr:clathrin coat assembly protein AP180-like [Salvia hispanica]
MPSKLKKAIAVVKDQTSISLAKVSSKDCANLEVAILKATSHEDVPIDDKYAYEVIRLVASNKIHAAACARAISKRIGRTRNWVVALKSLMLVLRIFQDGDPYFPREVLHAMKRGAKILNLSSFRDDSNSSPWDYTAFVRTFALYLDERLECFLTGKLQRRQALDGAAEASSVFQRSRSKIICATEPVRDMKPAMLLDKMSYWQRLLDRALATRPTGCAKENRLVHVALYAVLKESFDLYKDISEGLSLILDSFFHLQYQNCVIAFQTCIKAVKQFEEVSSFFSLCQSLGIGRVYEYPIIQAISDELIESLQEFLKDKSSFTNKPMIGNQMAAPAPPAAAPLRTRSARGHSYGAQSDFSVTTDGFSDEGSEVGSHAHTASASIDDLIRGAGTWKSRGISIDLEAYSSFKPDDAFGVSDTGSSRSLPVTSSGLDMMSVDDWSSEDEDEDEDENQNKGRRRREKLGTLLSKNWETVLAESAQAQAPAGMGPTPMPLIDINTNTFCAYSENSPLAAGPEQDFVLFEVERTEPETPASQHYNPFLEDAAETAAAATPTFQATPTFSAENPNVGVIEDDLFDSWADFPGDQDDGDGEDEQNLKEQQELWLQNQNKILEKNCS